MVQVYVGLFCMFPIFLNYRMDFAKIIAKIIYEISDSLNYFCVKNVVEKVKRTDTSDTTII